MYIVELARMAIKNKTFDSKSFEELCENLGISIPTKTERKKKKGWFKQAFYKMTDELKGMDIIEFCEKTMNLKTITEKQQYILRNMVKHPISIVLAGKGSGKDFMVSLLFNYMLAQTVLEDLEDITRIDFVNVAPNAHLAHRVFFKEFKHWFKKCLLWKMLGISRQQTGKHPIYLLETSVKVGDKITLHSGTSTATSFEGMNLLCAVIDEISDENFKNGEKLFYQAISSVKSRFGDKGKVVAITWTRFPTPNKLDDTGYKIYLENQNIPNVFLFKGKTWEINTRVLKETFMDDYLRNEVLAKKMYECEPPSADAYFISVEKLEKCMTDIEGLFAFQIEYSDGKVILHFSPKKKIDKKIYCHIDLSIKHDSTAIAIAYQNNGKIIVSDIVELQPTRGHIVDYHAIERFVQYLKNYCNAHISFDPFNSELLAQKYNCEVISFSMPNQVKMWKEFQKLVENEDILIKKHEKLKLQILQHQINDNKIVYHGEGSPDLADAVIPAVYNASKDLTKSIDWEELEEFYNELNEDYEILEYKAFDLKPII